MRSQFLYDESWLLDRSGEIEPWILVCREPNAQEHRNAFIGNGYIGQRVPPEGEGSGLKADRLTRTACWGKGHPITTDPVSGCMVAGLWGIDGWGFCEGLACAPRWSGLAYFDGKAVFDTRAGELEDYVQSLDMRRGTVRTSCRWTSYPEQPGRARTTRIETVHWVSRSRRNLGVVQTTITPEFDGRVAFGDSLSATGCQLNGPVNLRPGAPQSLETSIGPAARPVLTMSHVDVNGGRVHITRDEQTSDTLTRWTVVEVKAGQSVTITKAAVIVTAEDGPDLPGRAREILELVRGNMAAEFEAHIAAWDALWRRRIETELPHLQQLINAACYQLYANIEDGGRWSVGPCGLFGSDFYGGHAFWDSDLWMAPAVLLLHPEFVKAFVRYRYLTLDGARSNAKKQGYPGASYGWESGSTGDDLCPKCERRFVTACVALLQHWYGLASGDTAWRDKEGAEVILECARYLVARAEEAPDGTWHVRGIDPPDEFAPTVNDNAFTNAGVVRVLEAAAQVLERRGEALPAEWERCRQKMHIPRHPLGFINEYEGYDGQTIKQADATLLVHPLGWPMSKAEMRAMVDFFRSKYPPAKIMMGAAIDGIVACRLGNADGAWAALVDMLAHLRGPFLLASEQPDNECISFLTGHGGMLQLILMGFLGLKMSEGEVPARCIPPQIGKLLLHDGTTGAGTGCPQ